MRTVYKHILAIVALLLFWSGTAVAQSMIVVPVPGAITYTTDGCSDGGATLIIMASDGGNANVDYNFTVLSSLPIDVTPALTKIGNIFVFAGATGDPVWNENEYWNRDITVLIEVERKTTGNKGLLTLKFRIDTKPNSVTDVTGSVAFCDDGVNNIKITEIGGTPGVTYEWRKDGNKIDGQNQNTFIAKETGVYNVVTTRGGCSKESLPINVQANAIPEVTLSIPSVCDGEDLELQASFTTATVGPYTYDWSGPGYTDNTSVGTATIPNAHDPANSGTYKVEVTDANGCNDDATASITVSGPMDEGEIAVSISSVCKGETKNITLSSVKAPTGGHNPSYQWQMQKEGGLWEDIVGATDYNGWTGDITFDKTTKFRRHFHTDCGDKYAPEKTVTIVEPAVLDPGGTYTVCPGQTVTLQGKIVSGATQGTWSGGAGTWTAPTTLNGATYMPADSEYGTTVQLTLSTTDAGGECGQQSVTVDLVVAPEIKFTFNETEVCVNDVPFTPAVSATPTGGTGALVTVDFDVNIPFDPAAYVGAGPQKFKYQYTAGGCTAEEEFTITVTNPQVFAITNISPETYCASGTGVSINLDGSESGLTYTVYKDGNPTTHETTGTGSAISISGVKDGNGTYTIRATDANGCWIDMAGSVMLTEVSDIAGNDIAADQTICSGSNATPLTGPEPTGGNGTYIYQWRSSTDGTSWTDISGANSQNYDPGKVSAKTYYLRYVTSGACDDASTPVTISVTTPIQNNTIGADQTICYGAVPSKLTGEVATSSGGTVSYIWQVSTDGTSFTPAGGTERDFNPGIPLYADTWYRRVATDGGACPDDDKNLVKITVLEELKVSVTASTEPSCGNRNDGSLTATATGGKGSYTIFWKNNDDGTTYSGATINTATKGDYTVKVHEAGCATDATNSFTLNAPADVTGDPKLTHITTCFGRQEGSIEIINVTGGDGNYTYSVKDSAHLSPIGNVFANLYGGDYTIIITDGKGCGGTVSATIDQPTKVEITKIIPNPPTCDGKDDGSITVEATGGTGALTYTLNGGTPYPEGTATPNILAADTYIIEVTDVHGCPSEKKSETLLAPTPVTFNPKPNHVTGCPGSNTGSIELNISGGTGPYKYTTNGGTDWHPTSGEITGLVKSTYNIMVRDVNQCPSAEQMVEIEEPNALQLSLSADQPKCTGEKGMLKVKIVGGKQPYSVEISDGVNIITDSYSKEGEYPFPLDQNHYTVTVTDGSPCTVHDSYDILPPSPIDVQITETGEIMCLGSTESHFKFKASGGSGALYYSVDGGEPKQVLLPEITVIVYSLGLHTLDVTDGNCTEQKEVIINMGDAFNFEDDGVKLIKGLSCNSSNDAQIKVNVKNGYGPFVYMLYHQDDIAGTSKVSPETTLREWTFTDVPPLPSSLSPNKYGVYVVDKGNPTTCILHDVLYDVEVPVPSVIEPVIEDKKQITCHDDNDAYFVVGFTGGTGELKATLYKDGSVYGPEEVVTGSKKYENLDAGTYYVLVNDENNCGPVQSDDFVVINPEVLVAQLGSITPVSCYGDATGSIEIINITGGTAPYSYSVDGAEKVGFDGNTVVIGNLSEGSCTITIYDSHNCYYEFVPQYIDQPAEPLACDANFSGGCTDVEAVLVISPKGGTAPYTITVEGEAYDPAKKYSEGTYSILVVDHKGCRLLLERTWVSPVPISATKMLEIVQPTCAEDGKLIFGAVGGNPPLTYIIKLDGSEIDRFPSDEEIVMYPVPVTKYGHYEVRVEDYDGCWGTDLGDGDVNKIDHIEITSSGYDDVLCGGDHSGWIEVVATGGVVPPLSYALYSNGDLYRDWQDNGKFIELPAGDYQVVIKDEGICRVAKDFVINEPTPIQLSIGHLQNESYPLAGDGQIHINVIGGVAPYKFNLYRKKDNSLYRTNGDGIFNDVTTDEYRAEVIDFTGCSREIDVRIGGMLIKMLGDPNPLNCPGASDGSFAFRIRYGNAFEGDQPYIISMTNVSTMEFYGTEYFVAGPGPDTTYSISGLPAGTYRFTVRDKFGKSTEEVVRIFEPTPMNVVDPPVVNNAKCAIGGFGSVVFDISGDELYNEWNVLVRQGEYLIEWTDGQKQESMTHTGAGTILVPGLDPGHYKFTVSTVRGCTYYGFEIDIDGPKAIDVITNVLQESSYGAGNGLIEAKAEGGSGTYTGYTLKNATTNSPIESSPIGLFSNVKKGKYVVEVTDSEGCPGISDTIEIKGTNFVIDSTHSVSCYGGSNGEFWFTLGFGFKPFEVKVYNSANEPVEVHEPLTDSTYYVKDVAAGEYTITVEDSLFREGKVKELNYTVVVDEAKEMILDVLVLASKCELGEAEYDFNGGGTPDYTYLYSMDATASYDAYTALAPGETKYAFEKAGEYYFVVKDANGCYSNKVTRGATQADIDFTIGVTDNHCPGGQNGVITVAISNIDNYSFSLYQGGSMVNVSENGLFENLLADGGNFYGIEVTDKATLCSVRTPDTIRVNDGPAINLTVVGFSDDGSTLNCSYDTNGWIEAEATGGNGEFTYIWPDLGESTQRVDGLPAGDYTVIAVDSRDCPQSKTYTINGPAPFTFNPSYRVEAQCRKSTNASGLGGELHVSGIGATWPYTFTLVDETGHAATPSNNTGDFTGLGAGIYEVVVVDKNNCRYTMYDEILINPANDFDIGSMDTTVCFTNEVELKANMIFGDSYNDQYGLKYSWWSEANEGNITPDATGETYYVEGLDVNIYRYKLRVIQEGGPLCYVEKWFDVGVYPKLDIHVPLYVSTVQNDTILSILFNEEYNVDVSANNFDYNTQFEWFPKGVFVRENSWNTSIFMTPEKYAELKETYPNRFVIRRDPQTKRDGEFMLATVVGTTDVGCKDSLTLYTKIVNKLYLANVFSPNGDGRNDIWRIPKEYLFPDLEIEIFNRWGALVWSATGDRAARGWDGRSNNGKHLPIGTYWYVIKFNINSDDWKPLTGSVTIVK